jgi:hypothetical protein
VARDPVKQAVVEAVFEKVREGLDLPEGWASPTINTERTSNLELCVWVRPVAGQPRRMFVVKVSEII